MTEDDLLYAMVEIATGKAPESPAVGPQHPPRASDIARATLERARAERAKGRAPIKALGRALEGTAKGLVRVHPLTPLDAVSIAVKAPGRWRNGRRGRRGFAGFMNRVWHTAIRPALGAATGGLVR